MDRHFSCGPLQSARRMAQNEASAGQVAEASPGLSTVFREAYLSADVCWLGVFRVLYGVLLIVDLLRRWTVVRFYYTNDGILPNHFALFRPMGRNLFSIFHAFSSFSEVNVAFALTL